MELLVLTDRPARYDWERPHQVARRLPAQLGAGPGRVAWLATPSLLGEARAYGPDLLVYDVTGHLPGYREALKAADVVFTAGRSLQRAITTVRPDALCFASGVDSAHFARARALRRAHDRLVAGYAGTVDDRVDGALVAALGRALPGWEVRLVEPRAYADLPAILAQFDVGILPFALNERTPSLSPTACLEYLAAGLPVVATRMPDVADAFSDVVALEEGGPCFAAACRRVAGDSPEWRAARAQPLLKWHDWDAVARRMAQEITARMGAVAPAR